jgi:hypothetical protein
MKRVRDAKEKDSSAEAIVHFELPVSAVHMQSDIRPARENNQFHTRIMRVEGSKVQDRYPPP